VTQAFVIYLLGSLICILVTGKPIDTNEAAEDNLLVASGIISACIVLGVILWSLISTKGSKSEKSKKSEEPEISEIFSLSRESMEAIGHQVIGGCRLTQHMYPENPPPHLDPFPKPPEPPQPPLPPMPW